MIFLKQAHIGKSNLWRWFTVVFIMLSLLSINKEIKDYFSQLIYDFASLFPTTSGLIQVESINILYILFFTLLIYIFHKRSLKSFIVFGKFNFIHLFLALFWASFIYSLLMSTEILINPSAYEFHFQPKGFLELFFVGIICISLKTVFHQVFFNGYLLQLSSLLCKNRWCMILIATLITILFKLYFYHQTPLFNIHYVIFIIFFALFYNILTLLTQGLEVIMGVYFSQHFLATILISENWFDVTTNALFISVPNRNISSNLDIFLNYYLPMLFGIVQLFVIIKVFHINNWQKRIINND